MKEARDGWRSGGGLCKCWVFLVGVSCLCGAVVGRREGAGSTPAALQRLCSILREMVGLFGGGAFRHERERVQRGCPSPAAVAGGSAVAAVLSLSGAALLLLLLAPHSPCSACRTPRRCRGRPHFPALAAYLREVKSNKTLFDSYFAWRRGHTVASLMEYLRPIVQQGTLVPGPQSLACRVCHRHCAGPGSDVPKISPAEQQRCLGVFQSKTAAEYERLSCAMVLRQARIASERRAAHGGGSGSCNASIFFAGVELNQPPHGYLSKCGVKCRWGASHLHFNSQIYDFL